MPLAILSGYALANIFSSIIAFLFIIYSFKEKLIKYYKNTFFLIFILFCILIIISSTFSDHFIHSFKTSILYFRYGILAIAIWFCCETFKNFHRYFLFTSLIAFLLVLITGYYEFFNQKDIFGNNVLDSRLTLFTNGKMSIGAFLARFFPIIVALLFLNYKSMKKKNFIKAFFILFFVTTFVLVIMSGERTQVLVIAIPIIIFIFLANSLFYIRLIIAIMSISFAVFVLNFYPSVSDRMIKQTYDHIGFGTGEFYAFSKLHTQYYNNVLIMFQKNPVLGIGPNNFRIECRNSEYFTGTVVYSEEYWNNFENISDDIKKTYCTTHPHNFYIQLLGETGIVGFLFLVLAYIYLIIRLTYHLLYKLGFRNKLFNNYELMLVSYYLAILWPIMPTNNFFNSWMSIFIFLPLGFLISSIYNRKKSIYKNVENKKI